MRFWAFYFYFHLKKWNKNKKGGVSDRIPPKLNQVESMTRGIYLPSCLAIGWAVLMLSWGQGKICPTSVARWPWPKVNEMGTKKFCHTHRSTMCGLKKLVSRVFPESWKVLAERRWRRRWLKRGDFMSVSQSCWWKAWSYCCIWTYNRVCHPGDHHCD